MRRPRNRMPVMDHPTRRSWRSVRVVVMLSVLPFAALGCEVTTPDELTCPAVVAEPALAQGSPGDVVSVVFRALGGDPNGWVVQLAPVAGAMPITFEELDRLSPALPPVRASVQIPASTAVGRYTQTLSMRWGGISTGGVKCSFEQPTVSLEIDVVPPPVPPSFVASVSPSALSIEQGDSASLAVSITRAGGFAGVVNAAVTGLPDGVTATGGGIAAGENAGSLRLSVGPAAAAGTDTLTLTLSGTGVTSRTLPIELTITEPPGFDFVLAADSQLVYQGDTGEAIAVNVTRRGGFAGEISLAVEGVPAKVTATIESPGTGNTGSLTFAAAADTAQGNYALTVRARAEGLDDRTQTFTLSVLPPPAVYLVLNPFVRTAPNTSVTVDLEIQRISWEGDVTLSVTRAPGGISASLAPAVTSGDTATLRLGVGSVAPGSYEVELLATGATGLRTTAVVFLTVANPDG